MALDIPSLVAFGQNPLVWLIFGGAAVYLFYLWYEDDLPHPAWKGVAIILALFLLASNFTFNGVVGGILLGSVAPPVTPPPSGSQQTGTGSALLVSGLVQNYYTHVAMGATTTVELLQPGNYALRIETLSCSSGVFTSASYYAPGTKFTLHIYSTDGTNTYYPTEVDNVVVPSQSSSASSNQQVYWLGTFYLKQRCTGSQLTATLTNSTGYTLSSATGTTGTTNTLLANTATGYFSAATSAGKTFQLRVNIFLTTTGITWGYQDSNYGRVGVPVITSSLGMQERQLALWLTVNNTGVSMSTLEGDGWILIPNYAATYLTFYRIIQPVEQASVTSTSPGTISYLIDIDTSAIASSKNVTVGVWAADIQNPLDAANGNYNSFPSAAGAFGGYGQTALMPATYYLHTPTAPETGAWLSCKFMTK